MRHGFDWTLTEFEILSREFQIWDLQAMLPLVIGHYIRGGDLEFDHFETTI
jgi:hypothetical protein